MPGLPADHEETIMLNVLITGRLTKDPRTGTGKNGSSWTSATVRIPMQPDAEGANDCVFASCIAFGDEAGKLALLGAGDAVSVTGTARLSTWTGKDGVTKPTLDVQATAILTVYQLRKRRGDTDRAPAEKSARSAPPPDEWGRTYGRPGGRDFDDAITF